MKEIKILEADISLNLYVDEDYRYDDSYDFEDVLSEEEYAKLREFVINNVVNGEPYFKCEINGVTKEIKLGNVIHSKRQEGILVRGALFEKTTEESPKVNRYDNQFKVNSTNDIVRSKIINERLINLLIDKEIITEVEASKIREVTREELVAAKFDYSTF